MHRLEPLAEGLVRSCLPKWGVARYAVSAARMEDESKHPEGESKQEFGTEDDGGENRGEEPEPEPEPEALSEEEGGGEAKDDAEPAAPRAVGADVRSVITDAVKRLNEMRADSGCVAAPNAKAAVEWLL